MFRTIIFFTCIVFPFGLAQTATIYVPDDYTTIQGAIDASINGDMVIVRPGSYAENIDFIGKAITVQSERGSFSTIIDGNQAGSVVAFVSNEGADSVLDGFTLTNGTGTPDFYGDLIGGGIYCLSSSSPTISYNVISGNSADHGGGIYCLDFSSPMITSNTFSGNVANTSGAGIHCWGDSSPTITDNSIVDNTSYLFGGGIDCWYSSPIIARNTISGNKAANFGGGIFTNHSSPTITNNIICGNTVFSQYGDGGGIFSDDGSPTITNNIIAGNDASGGGGISCWGFHEPIITSNTIAGNTANYGGGIAIHTNWPTISNTILWGNSAPTDPEIRDNSYGVVVTYCDVKGGWPGTGNIDSDPMFISEGYWDDNDTPWDPTDDYWVNGDYHLAWQSPCRDSGDNSTVTDSIDIEGDPRIALGTVDIGADEYYYHLYHMGDVVPGSPIDLKVIGYPTAPVTLYLGSSIADPPHSTQHGDFYLNWPPLWQGSIGTIPSNGVLVFPATVPPGWTSGSVHPLQALVGPWGGPWTWLTNVETLVLVE